MTFLKITYTVNFRG